MTSYEPKTISHDRFLRWLIWTNKNSDKQQTTFESAAYSLIHPHVATEK